MKNKAGNWYKLKDKIIITAQNLLFSQIEYKHLGRLTEIEIMKQIKILKNKCQVMTVLEGHTLTIYRICP